MADEVVGSAYVIIRALANKIKDDIKDGVKRGVEDADLEKAGESIGDEIGEAAGDRTSEHIAKSVKDTDRKHRGDLNDAGERIGDTIGEGIERSGALRRIGQRIANVIRRDRTTETRGRGWGQIIGRRIGTAIGSAISAVPLLPFILAMLVPALGGVLKILAAYVGAATALLAQMGPAVAGLGTIYGSTMLAIYQGVGAVTLALKAQSPLLDKFKEDMKQIGERFQDIGRAIQEVMFPRLTAALQSMADDILPILRRNLIQTGRVVATIAERFERLANNPIFQRSFGRVLDNNNWLLNRLGRAAANLAGALVYVLDAARPVIRMFGDWALRVARAANDSARLGTKTGELAEWFRKAADNMRQWGRIIGNFGRGLFNVFKAAMPAGQTLMNRLEKLTARFRAFTESAEGKNKMAVFFENSIKIVRAFNKLLGATFKLLFGGLAKPGAAKGTVEFLNALRTEMLPALASLADSLSTLGPGLIDLTEAFAGFIERLADSGALGAFTSTLTVMFELFSKILDMPIAGQLGGIAFALLGIGKAMNIATFGLFGKALGKIGGAIGKFIDKAGGLRKIFTTIGKSLGGFVATIGRLAGAFLVAIGPVGWVILAIGLLVGAFVLLWKKSESFRNFWKGLWEKIKDAASAVGEWFTGTLVPWFQGVWDKIKGGLSAVGGFFSSVWNAIKNTVSSIFGAIVGVIRGYLNAILGFWRGVWGLFGPLVKAVFNLIVAIIRLGWTIISEIFKTALLGLRIVTTVAWNFIKKVTSTVWKAIQAAIRVVWGIIKTVVSTGVGVVKTVVTAAWNFIKGVTSAVWNAIKAVISAVWNQIKGVVMPAVNAVKTVISAAWNFIKDATQRIWDGIKSAVKTAIDTVVSTVTGLKDRVVSFFSGAGTWLLNAGRELIGGLISGITEKIDDLTGLVSGAAQKVKDFFPGSPVKTGPLRSWNNGGAGKRLNELLAEGLKDTRQIDKAAATMAKRVGSHFDKMTSPTLTARAGASGASYARPALTRGGRGAVTNNFNINNPLPERSGRSVTKALQTRIVDAGWTS